MNLSGYTAAKPKTRSGQLLVEFSRRPELELKNATPDGYCLETPETIAAQFTEQNGLVRVMIVHFYPMHLSPDFRPITEPGVSGVLQYMHHIRDLQNFGRDAFAKLELLARLRFGPPQAHKLYDGDRERAHAELGDLLQEATWAAPFAHMSPDREKRCTTTARLELRLQAGAWNFLVYESGLACCGIEDWAAENFIAKELVSMGKR